MTFEKEMKASDDTTEAKKILKIRLEDKAEPPKDERKPVEQTCYACNKHGHIARNCKEVRPFNGYCYSCNKFGHRAINCRTSQRNQESTNQRNHPQQNVRSSQNITCQICNYNGHTAR